MVSKAAGMRRERHHTHRRHHRGRTRHHSASPYTYSHHHAHVFTPIRVSTRIFAYERARAARRHAPNALSGLGTARDHPWAGPDRLGAGPKLPGAPDTTAPTWAARDRPDQHMALPSTAPPARARPSQRPPPAPPALRERHPHRRDWRRPQQPLLRPCRPPIAVVPALERREQRVRVA